MLASVRQWLRDLIADALPKRRRIPLGGTSPARRLVILRLLAMGPAYTRDLVNECVDAFGDSNDLVIFETLRWMECEGYVSRTVEAESPERANWAVVRYWITDAGRALLEASEGEGTVGQ
jgi:DNA-binding HxlR family transcriptional regulator